MTIPKTTLHATTTTTIVTTFASPVFSLVSLFAGTEVRWCDGSMCGRACWVDNPLSDTIVAVLSYPFNSPLLDDATAAGTSSARYRREYQTTAPTAAAAATLSKLSRSQP